jgi:hypothetical protein
VVNLYLIAFVGITLLGFAAAFGVIVWLARLLPAHVEKKYSWVARTKGKLPFFKNWEQNIDAEDVNAFRRYRKLFLAWYGVAAILLVVEFLIWQQLVGGGPS